MPKRARPVQRRSSAYVVAGSIAAAAHELGISERTARQHLSGLYRRLGYLNAAQAAYWLGLVESSGMIADHRDRHERTSVIGYER
jgi:hypothetical protein